MACIIVCVETNEITIEDPKKNLSSNRKDTAEHKTNSDEKDGFYNLPIDFTAREGCVKEETNFDV